MNKMIKLPLFLGVVGGICGGLLAATNAITADVIKKGEDERIAAAYKEHFASCVRVDNANFTADAKGLIKSAVNAYDSSDAVLGKVYTVTVKGYGGDYTFTASFAGDKVHKVIMVSGNESNVGLTFLNKLYSATDYTVEGVADFASGSSVTYKAVAEGLTACYTDFKGGN